MSSTFSRVLSAGTAAYAVFALAKPRHLGAALTDDHGQQATYDLVAKMFGLRDLTISAAGVLARSPQAVGTAMFTRIALDLADAGFLAPRAETAQARQRVLAATLGWASLNTVAALVDRRRRRS